MRIFLRLIACAGIAVTVAGCDPTDKHYFTQGVGTNVYSDDVVAQTQLQDTYVEQICHQAGLAPGNCSVDNFSPMVWRLFVQAGMNDIDQRCDAYLTWLDNVRRAQAPTIKQIADTQTASTLIMQATGVGAGPIAIVAAAFGFASNTFTNVTSRLVLEVDHSTVQAVVLSHQKEYREDLFGSADNSTSVVISSKPAAIYALRSYLRLCMPMTIETQINTIMTTFSRGGTVALNAGTPMISAGTVGSSKITNVNAPVPTGPTAPTPSADRKGDIEIKLTDSTIRSYQNALCVTPADGKLGPKTRTAISEYLTLRGKPDASAQFDRRTPAFLQDAVNTIDNCRSLFFTDVYEVVTYGNPATRVERIKKLQARLIDKLPDKGAALKLQANGHFGDDSKLNDPTRSAIAEVRKLLHPNDSAMQDTTNRKNRQMDAQFDSDLL